MLSLNISKDLTDCSDFGRSCLESFRSAGVPGVLYLFITAVFIFTILGNLSIIISISYFKQLHSPTNFLILSMAGTDFLLGFAIMPCSMVRSVEKCWVLGIIFCKVHYSFDLMLCLSSIFHLYYIAMDRFYAICHLLHYTSTMTMAAIKQITAVCSSVPVAFAAGVIFSEAYVSGIEGYEMLTKCLSLWPVVFNKLWGAFLFTVGLFAPACIMIGIYVKFFAVSQRHTWELSQAHRHSKIIRNMSFLRIKIGKLLRLRVLLCWVYQYAGFSVFFAILMDPFLNFSVPLSLFDSVNWPGYLNSFCNPLIYGFFYPWFWKTFKNILKGKIFNPHFHRIKLLSEDQSQ